MGETGAVEAVKATATGEIGAAGATGAAGCTAQHVAFPLRGRPSLSLKADAVFHR